MLSKADIIILKGTESLWICTVSTNVRQRSVFLIFVCWNVSTNLKQRHFFVIYIYFFFSYDYYVQEQ